MPTNPLHGSAFSTCSLRDSINTTTTGIYCICQHTFRDTHICHTSIQISRQVTQKRKGESNPSHHTTYTYIYSMCGLYPNIANTAAARVTNYSNIHLGALPPIIPLPPLSHRAHPKACMREQNFYIHASTNLGVPKHRRSTTGPVSVSFGCTSATQQLYGRTICTYIGQATHCPHHDLLHTTAL